MKKGYVMSANGNGERYIKRNDPSSYAGGVVEKETPTHYIVKVWQDITRASYWEHQIWHREIEKSDVEIDTAINGAGYFLTKDGKLGG